MEEFSDSKTTYYNKERWQVNLSKNQAYLGYSIVLLKRECRSLSELSDEEWSEFHKVVKYLESKFKEKFDATMFNWTCLMNDAYKQNPPKPYVHFHFRPRYRDEVKIGNEIFKDKEFAHHYNKKREKIVSEDVLDEIVKVLKL